MTVTPAPNLVDKSDDQRPMLAWAPNKYSPGHYQALWDDGFVKHPYEVREVADALSTEFGVDAHCVTYVVYKDGQPLDTQPRLIKDGLYEVRENGFEVFHACMMVDVDLVPHARRMDDETAKDVAAKMRHVPDCGIYLTRGGFRVVRTLKNHLTPEQYEAAIPPFITEIQAAMGDGYLADPACKDWTRHFRLPNVRREGERAPQKAAMRITNMSPVDNEVPKVALVSAPPPYAPDPAAAKKLKDNDGNSAYGLKALAEETVKVGSAPDGSKHTTLTACAFRIGQLVGGGEIDEQDAIHQFEQATRGWDNPKKVAKTLKDCLRNGARHHRTAPPSERGYQMDPRAEAALTELIEAEAAMAEYGANQDRDQHDDDPGGDADCGTRSINLMKAFKRRGKAILGTATNAAIFLRSAPGWRDRIAWDSFQGDLIWNQPPDPQWVKNWPSTAKVKAGDLWTDQDTNRLVQLMGTFGLNIEDKKLEKVLVTHAQEHRRHPLQDYLSGLSWDGSPRLDHWQHRYLGAQDTQHNQRAGRWWMIQAVRRAMNPGCIGKYVLVLEGPQNIGKSGALRVLASPEWFLESKVDMASKEAAMILQGHWIVELPEGEILTRHSAEVLKSFIGNTTDTIIPKHSNRKARMPRACVFAMTVNPDQTGGYLSDPTGNVRYWPVECKQFTDGCSAAASARAMRARRVAYGPRSPRYASASSHLVKARATP